MMIVRTYVGLALRTVASALATLGRMVDKTTARVMVAAEAGTKELELDCLVPPTIPALRFVHNQNLVIMRIERARGRKVELLQPLPVPVAKGQIVQVML